MLKFRDMISHRIDTPKSRLASIAYTELVDHAILRHFWTNVKEIDDGVFRSNHPTHARLKKFKEAGGAAVLNLRGVQVWAPVVLERESCRQLGLEYIYLPMTSAQLPERKTVCDLVEILRTAPRPLLMHCKSGADRTGLAAGIYMLAFKNATPQAAAAQLSWRHAHNRFSDKAILRDFFTLYQPAYDAGQDFMDWVRNDYDPKQGKTAS